MNPAIHHGGFRRLSATVLCCVIASSFAALPAAEAESFDAPQVKVTFGDLDVSRPEGAAVLYRRIKAAAETVCSPYWATGLAARLKADDCVRSAIAEAVTAVGAKTHTPLTLRSASLR